MAYLIKYNNITNKLKSIQEFRYNYNKRFLN